MTMTDPLSVPVAPDTEPAPPAPEPAEALDEHGLPLAKLLWLNIEHPGLPGGKKAFAVEADCQHDTRLIMQGLYGFDGMPKGPAVVLDFGGHSGAFSTWARARWPQARICAYEPNPDTLRFFRHNTSDLRIDLFERAVISKEMAGKLATRTLARYLNDTSDEGKRVTLYKGAHNSGEASLYRDLGEQQLENTFEVSFMYAEDLPRADFLKLDCEGSELDILEHYPHLGQVSAVSLEYHRLSDRWHIGALLTDAGLTIVSEYQGSPGFGLMRWTRKT